MAKKKDKSASPYVGHYRKATLFALAATAVSVIVAAYLYTTPLHGHLARYPLLVAVTFSLICAVSAYLWKRPPRNLTLVHVKQFFQAFVIFEALYYVAMFVGLQLLPSLHHYAAMVFDPGFMTLSILLSVGGYYVKLIIYEYLNARKARKAKP